MLLLPQTVASGRERPHFKSAPPDDPDPQRAIDMTYRSTVYPYA